jgi:hypothetical protein
MVTRISNHIRGVLKTFGLLPGSVRGKPFTEQVEALVADGRMSRRLSCRCWLRARSYAGGSHCKIDVQM